MAKKWKTLIKKVSEWRQAHNLVMPSALSQEIRQARKYEPVTCEFCGHTDTQAELRERVKRGYMNDEPRKFCSRKCQKAAWEKQNGARRKREYRAKNVPTLTHSESASGQGGTQ